MKIQCPQCGHSLSVNKKKHTRYKSLEDPRLVRKTNRAIITGRQAILK